MRTLMNKGLYRLSFNEDFEGVIHGCSVSEQRFENEYAWLGSDMIAAYTEMHRNGFAASVEVWEGTRLVGGLYGVTIGYGFIGESMFSLVPNASKLALIHLARMMAGLDYHTLIDCQFETPHLRSMGGRFISYEEYMNILKTNSV